nr:hypothetical protein HmN_000358200 [Hymenolepis microstoma]
MSNSVDIACGQISEFVFGYIKIHPLKYLHKVRWASGIPLNKESIDVLILRFDSRLILFIALTVPIVIKISDMRKPPQCKRKMYIMHFGCVPVKLIQTAIDEFVHFTSGGIEGSGGAEVNGQVYQVEGQEISAHLLANGDANSQ